MSGSLTAINRAGFYIASEANFWRSRDHVLIASGKLAAATVLGRYFAPNSLGVVVSKAKATNTGNGLLTVDATTPVVSGGQQGVYTASCTTAATNGGTFTITDPGGAVVGTVAVAATFNNQLKFSIADGASDFVVGDSFALTVTKEYGSFGQLVPGGSGGIEVAAGILFDAVDATLLPKRGVASCRDTEVDGTQLVWPVGITASQKATAYTQLAALGIVIRD